MEFKGFGTEIGWIGDRTYKYIVQIKTYVLVPLYIFPGGTVMRSNNVGQYKK